MTGTETNTPATLYASASADDSSSAGESYYWIMIALLMIFVLALLILLKRARRLGFADYPDKLSDLTEHNGPDNRSGNRPESSPNRPQLVD